MASYTYRMPAGIAGEVTRFDTGGVTLSPEKVNTSAATTGAGLSPASWAYGAVVIVDSNGARPIVGTDTAFSILTMGFLARPYPRGDLGVAFPAGTVGFGPGAPPLSGIVDVLRRGYMSVLLGGSTAAAKGGAVYVYTGTSTGAHVQGRVEAASGANLTQLAGAFFQGPADANSNVELAYNL